jgi:hypothetical protein
VLAFAAAIVVGFVNADNNTGSFDAAGSSTTDLERAQGPLSTADFAATRSGTTYHQDKLDSQVTQLVAARSQEAGGAQDSEVMGSGVAATPNPTPAPSDAPTDGSSPTASPSTQDSVPTSARVAPMATDPAAAQACLESYLGVSDVAPLAIDIGVWQGHPAAVIVLPLDDPTLAEVWVINPKCTTSSSKDPLYYYATISR